MKKYYHLIGIVIFIIILTRIDFKKILSCYSEVNLAWLGLVNLIILPNLFAKAYRWRYLLCLQGITYPVGASFAAYLGGIYTGLVTPGRIGEAMKAVYLKTEKGISLSEGMASVIIDRLFDLYLLILLGSIGFLSFLGFKNNGYNVFVLFLLLFLLLIPLALFNKPILEKTARIVYKVAISKIDKSLFDNQFKNFLSAVKKIISGRILFAFILTIFSHMFYFLQCYLLARLMSINISFVTLIFFISIATLLSMLPITIWGFGTREASLAYCFSMVGLSVESAVSYSFLLFTSFYLISGFFSFLGWVIKGHYGLRILT
ncbi:MAG: flippase-like domain-containing protein [Candidatus Omnitrophica bacterium]|nr:flippase-like domain-containing protein [Candidatus Omnitrophota bacterium]